MVQEKTYNGIDVTIASDYEELGRLAANIILERIYSHPKMTLLVPTGTTPLGVYRVLRHQNPKIFKKATFLNMDEYCILVDDKMMLIPETHPNSYKRYMNENLFNRITPEASYFPGIENVKELGHYDNFIKNLGGIDLCLDSIGQDGHTFGFNHPGTSFDSRTRLIRINKETREINRRLTGLETPEYAITTGLKTGVESREIIFLVSGERKADILYKVIYAVEPTPDIPATILRQHSNCIWIVDKKAASKLG